MGKRKARRPASAAATPSEGEVRPARRTRVLAVLAGALVVVLGAAFWWARSPLRSRATSRPNVLLVTIDTLRADHLGCYGYAAARTPTLDALAASGVRFATAIAHVPLTTPSHASILTGLTPLHHGVRDNGDFVLPSSIPTLAEALRDSGYETGAFVSGFPLDRRFGLARGFLTYDDRLPHGHDSRRAAYIERTADRTTTAALAWLGTREPQGAPTRREPWLLWVHYFDPHSPYEPPQAFADSVAGRPYDGEIAFVDEQLGRLLRGLGEARDRTVVLATADHGEGLGEHGEYTHGVFLYDSTLKVPWLMAGPGLPRGKVATTVARLIDVAATLLDLAGVPGLPSSEGRSLRAAGRQELAEAPVYVESLYSSLRLGWAELHAWRTSRFKLILAPRPELYDLASDPGETKDRYGEEGSVVSTLSTALHVAMNARPPSAARDAGSDAAERFRALGYIDGGHGPGDRKAPGKDPKDAVELLGRLERAMALVRSEPHEASRELSAVLEQDPGLLVARRYLALALTGSGDLAGAIRSVESLMRQDAATFDDLLLLADDLRLLGRLQAALPVLDDAEKMQRSSPEPAVMRARVFALLGQAPQAQAEFERALGVAPTHREALRGLGDLALSRGDLEGAARNYAALLSSDPEDVGALVKLGTVRVRQGRASEAAPLLERAVAGDPGNGEALLALGGLLAKGGRAPDAVPFFERAVAAGARSAVAFNSLGFARLEAGDRRGALTALRASLAIEPHQREIAQVVSRLAASTAAERAGP